VNREIVHLGDGEFGVLTADELDKAATLTGGDFAVGDLAEVVEEGLRKEKESVSRKEGKERERKRTLSVSSLMHAGNPPTNTVVLFGSPPGGT
jgi:hypothetical protein